jgi:tRNA pseudouridine55 synthase
MNGIINVLKPPGMTSHDVVGYLRKLTGIKKIGHTGTLDPGAAGVLPICIGKATKIVDYIMNDRKEYICELTLGNATDTCDKYGEFLYAEEYDYSGINEESLLAALEAFRGDITQIPPAYSAVKINGIRAYDLARQGREVNVPSRRVTVYNIELLSFDLPKAMLKIECSKGTYIRSICRDIGNILGTRAYMSFLLRTRTGGFTLDNAYTLEEMNSDNIGSMLVDAGFALDMSKVYLDEELSRYILNGNSVGICQGGLGEDELVKVYIKPENFTAIGRVKDSRLYIEKLMV